MTAADAGVVGTSLVPDAELIERITQGDEEAFELLYQRYFPRVFSFTRRRLANRADTEETVQEVFLAIFSSLDSYRGDAPFGAWVLGVTRRTIASRFKRKRHPTVALRPEELEPLEASSPIARREPTPLEHYECGERLEKLQDTVAHRLSPEQREVFELHHLQHRSIHEIARRQRKSEDAVKSNLYRARKLLLAR